MPFLAVTLIWILNSARVPREWRNRTWSNVVLVLITLTFAFLAFDQPRSTLAGTF